MCIICYKPALVDDVGYDLYERCFTKNGDGAGFAIMLSEGVYYEKGLMTFAKWRERYEAYRATVGEELWKASHVISHFRIGTHGSKADPKHTHPFPVCDDYEQMTHLAGTTPRVMMHNGIFRLGKLAGNHDIGKELKPSDSMEFACNVMHKLAGIDDAGDIIGELAEGNRVLDMDATRQCVTLYGNFVHDKASGHYYSNSGYEAPKSYSYEGGWFDPRYESDLPRYNSRASLLWSYGFDAVPASKRVFFRKKLGDEELWYYDTDEVDLYTRAGGGGRFLYLDTGGGKKPTLKGMIEKIEDAPRVVASGD